MSFFARAPSLAGRKGRGSWLDRGGEASRSVITGIIFGAAVATFGLTVIPKAAKSLPLGTVKAGAVKPQDIVEEARVTVQCIRAGAIAVATGAAGGTGEVACAAGASSQPTPYPQPAT
jgi:hypothetical protein